MASLRAVQGGEDFNLLFAGEDIHDGVPVRMLMGGTRPLEKQHQLLYLCQSGHCLGQSGVGDRGPAPRANRVGAPGLVRGVGFGPTSPPG